MLVTRLFRPGAKTQSERHKHIYAAYELWYTIVDVSAALCFVVGSFLFLSEATKTIATWMFVLGSFLFLMKPIIRLMREARYLADGDVDTLAKRAGWKSDDK